MQRKRADVIREYGPFPGVDRVHGVTFDGHHVWFASTDQLHALDPDSGEIVRTFAIAARAGTAFDGRHLYQIAEGLIHKIDLANGKLLKTIPAPDGPGLDSGLAWAEGTLWVGEYRGHRIHQIDPETGALLRTLESDRFVTGVTWSDGELWHATAQDDASEVRRIDPATGEVLERIDMPEGSTVSGLEAGGRERFFCGGGGSGKIRAIRRGRTRTRT
ncbi:MAG: glutamine cyclotransferase [Rhodanobacteraceae bacterium]|nr:MAG: glutamine cyclotransferase [Rhodanobacteraceae bacterium]